MDTEKTYTEKDIAHVFLRIASDILLDLYTNENVVFGRIKPNDKVPIAQYLDEIGFRNMDTIIDGSFLNGNNIENGYVSDRDFDKRCFELYRNKIDCMFDNVPIDKSYADDGDIFHYKYGLYEYLKGVYAIFREIITTEIEPDFYITDLDMLDKEAQQSYYCKATKFVKAIKRNRLKQGSCVDRYVKDLPFISPFIGRLIVKRKGRFLLKNSDTDSTDYTLALLSCFRFYNPNNAKLFMAKLLRWESLRNM